MSIRGDKGDQLKLFDSASNLIGDLLDGRMGSWETDLYSSHDGPLTPAQKEEANGSMLSQKLYESQQPFESGGHGAGVYDSIKEHGFKGHITVDQSRSTPAVFEGHHRLAAAGAMEGDQWVGLNHVDPGAAGSTRKIDADYESSYPQNVSDLDWAKATDSKQLDSKLSPLDKKSTIKSITDRLA